ncbi:hypothetical protein FOA52_007847 [Chlamydomonas sp. UWO 241]|nr:hypothetical protein FOA52_007847 [Chlamydomonas sp. UWO 241]
MGSSVLLNGLIFARMWAQLDAGDKRQLRAVRRGVRALADGLVVALTLHESATVFASALARWPNLQRLASHCDDDCAAVINAAPLCKLRSLVLEYHAELASTYGSAISDLAPLGGCAKLKRLWIVSSQVSDLAPLRGCVELQDLDISMSYSLGSLAGLEVFSKLERLNMLRLSVSSLEPLSACGQLKDLNISQCKALSSLAPLSACCQLERLNMAFCSSVSSFAPLSACTNLKKLNMSCCRSVPSVEPLATCAQLEELTIFGLAIVGHLPGLAALKAAMPRLRVVKQ